MSPILKHNTIKVIKKVVKLRNFSKIALILQRTYKRRSGVYFITAIFIKQKY